jgi:hypothetical protein
MHAPGGRDGVDRIRFPASQRLARRVEIGLCLVMIYIGNAACRLGQRSGGM